MSGSALVSLTCGAVVVPLMFSSLSVSARVAVVEPSLAPVAASDDDDLTSLREAAVREATAAPSADAWRKVGDLAARAGDYEAAARAYRAELAALGKGDTPEHADARARWQRTGELARGAVADEGPSSHRAQFDATWAPPPPPARRTLAPAAAPPPVDVADDRIVTKWYFWVTLAAIAASAAAVTGIAIKAARDDKPDALDRAGVSRRRAPAVLRFEW